MSLLNMFDEMRPYEVILLVISFVRGSELFKLKEETLVTK